MQPIIGDMLLRNAIYLLSQMRYMAFTMRYDINPLSPRRAYRAHQRISRATHISKIPSGIYIAAAFSRCQLIGIMSIVL